MALFISPKRNEPGWQVQDTDDIERKKLVCDIKWSLTAIDYILYDRAHGISEEMELNHDLLNHDLIYRLTGINNLPRAKNRKVNLIKTSTEDLEYIKRVLSVYLISTE